ncbi:MAG: fasciclin domain-containing protein [Steroidobacteraceae bacterium]|nr:fasciclin domain-containing protein [Steroidobacteraceae bacterium]
MKISFKAIAAAFAASVLLAGPAAASGKGAPEINKIVRVKGTIVDVAVSNPAFSTLVTALKAAQLVDVLQGPGPFTVFAPTNDAFGKIPADVLTGLVNDVPALTEVLLYHVTPGRQDLRFSYLARDLRTVQGQEVFAERERNTLFINNSQVAGSAIVTDNGVIYVIDSVLLPQYR